jgi:hypothetical protein
MSFKIPLPKTADITSPEIIELCKKIVPDSTAFYIKVKPINKSVVNECYGNVDRAIKQNGGEIQYGWQIWETLPGVMAEAEFHAVWIDPKGEYCDVTPKETPGITKILFLSDPTRVYSGRQIDNVRIALKDDSLVHTFIKNAESYYEVMNRGELADYHGYIVLTPEMIEIKEQNSRLFLAIIKKFY